MAQLLLAASRVAAFVNAKRGFVGIGQSCFYLNDLHVFGDLRRNCEAGLTTPCKKVYGKCIFYLDKMTVAGLERYGYRNESCGRV
jgi:hypothetical protein